MRLPQFIEQRLLQWVDRHFEQRPQPLPSVRQLQQSRIVSHRGAHENDPVMENTIAAFERAATAGVWGIELDLRYSADLEPVVCHDADLSRVYGRQQKIGALRLGDIEEAFPAIPSLSDVVQRFAKEVHLMIEVKHQDWPDPDRQVSRLEKILSGLTPGEDYHLLGLHPGVLKPLGGFAREAWLLISEYGPALRSRWIRQHRWGGLCGHYLLIGSATIEALHGNGQKVGSGYVQSRNCLFREINRGVDWIFSNDAIGLQQIVNTCLSGGAQREQCPDG